MSDRIKPSPDDFIQLPQGIDFRQPGQRDPCDPWRENRKNDEGFFVVNASDIDLKNISSCLTHVSMSWNTSQSR